MPKSPFRPLFIWLHLACALGLWAVLVGLVLDLAGVSSEIRAAVARSVAARGMNLIALFLLVGLCYGLWSRPFQWAWAGLGLVFAWLISASVPWNLAPSWLYPPLAGRMVPILCAAVAAGLIVQLLRGQDGPAARYDVLTCAVLALISAWLVWQGIETVQTAIAVDRAYGLGAADQAAGGPLSVPAHIVPEWYALHAYAALRGPADKIMGLILMAAVTLAPLGMLSTRAVAVPFWKARRLRWMIPAMLATLVALGAGAAEPAARVLANVLSALWIALCLVGLPWAARPLPQK